MKKERKWKESSRLKGVLDVDAVADEINELIATNGGSYTARELRDKAKNPDSAIHDGIEWDKEVAADLYQIDQARHISRSIVTVIHHKDTGEPPLEVRDYVAVTFRDDDTGKQYAKTSDVLAKEDLRIEFLTAALREMQTFKKKYEFIAEFKALIGAIDDASEFVQEEIA